MEENKPLETDPSEETVETESTEEGQKDVGTEEARAELSLDELNALSGREGDNAFKSKDDFEKHYQNLKSLVGDQEAIKARKDKPESKEESKDDDVRKELEMLKSNLAEKEFLAENPDAKDKLDIVQAYADKNSLDLAKAWDKLADKFTASGDSKLITNQRINPVKSADRQKLIENARSGNSNYQEEYVAEMLGTDKGHL